MYVTYLTTYSDDKLPRFYIGSSTKTRVENGYHGSVRSQKYRALWESELTAHPELFSTAILSEHDSRDESLEAEEAFQMLHNAVKSPDYINMAYARGGFINSGPEAYTPEVKAKMRAAKLGKKLSVEHIANVIAANTGRKNTPEQKERMRQAALTRKKAPPVSDETRKKLSESTRKVWESRKEK